MERSGGTTSEVRESMIEEEERGARNEDRGVSRRVTEDRGSMRMFMHFGLMWGAYGSLSRLPGTSGGLLGNAKEAHN
eukprot:3151129-Pyramimonas_sp.AAC.1